MKQRLKLLAINMLGVGNAFPASMTDKNNIELLMQKLFPVATDHELIRLGPKGDGGYLVPNDLEGVKACFSPGVCEVSDFEKDCADLGMQVFMADKSVDKPATSHELFHFIKKYVGVTTNDDFMTVDNWVSESLPNSQSDLLLQIDIEGYEYETFLAMSDDLMGRYRIVVAEFHNLDQLWNRPFFQLASRAFEKILQTHICVHIHPNNVCAPLNKGGLSIPPTMEFSFLRKDRIKSMRWIEEFPHSLDADNSPKTHYPLPECWYKKRQSNEGNCP